jgi:hypothetical protein
MSEPAVPEAEVRRFVADWYRLLDVHAPGDEVAALVAGDVEFTLPEGLKHGRDQFRAWYEGVIRIFFDEVHELSAVEMRPGEGGAIEVGVVVRWEASFWSPPSAWSRRLNMIARQRWALGREAAGGRLVIRRYVVDRLDPLPGSAALPTA